MSACIVVAEKDVDFEVEVEGKGKGVMLNLRKWMDIFQVIAHLVVSGTVHREIKSYFFH